VLAALVPFLAFGVWESARGTRLKHIDRNFDTLRAMSERTPGAHQ